MDLELAIAGAGSLLLALGHTTIGARWVLPGLNRDSLPATPFGPPSLTLGMLRFSWIVVSLALSAFGVLFIALAADPGADTKELVVRWLAMFWTIAAAVALWSARRRPSLIVRFPVPIVLAVVAAMSWMAA